MTWKKFNAAAAILAIGALTTVACSDDNGTQPTPQPPTAPTGVTASASGTTVTVAWQLGTGATSQRVELSHSSEATRTNNETAAATSSVFTNLTPGQTYTAQVVAVNSDGETASGTASVTLDSETSDVVVVNARITADQTWTADKSYIIDGVVFVGEDCGPDPSSPLGACNAVTLTIEPGTTILGTLSPPAPARSSYLVVTRGSQIIADANANEADKSVRPDPDNVIVFTSNAPAGSRARTDWGGLIINGRADVANAGEAIGEGDSGFYGGVDDTDSSGILRGVRVEFAGDNFTETDQLNGIAFQGVGAGTTVDYVQVHYNEDDGVEPFGGAVSMTHMVMSGIGDDSFDGTDGYRGFIQFGIAQQRADAADQGFEFSTAGDNPNDSDLGSTAVVANVTLVGAKHTGEIASQGSKSDYGILHREGSNWRIFNTLVTGFGRAGFCVEKDGTQLWAENQFTGASTAVDETLRTEGTIIWANGADITNPVDATQNLETNCAPADEYANNAAFFQKAEYNNMLEAVGLPAGAFTIGSQSSPPDFIPASMPAGYTEATFGSISDGLVPSVDGRALTQTNYAGGIAPGTSLVDAWYYGWTIWTTNGADSRPAVAVP